MPRSTIIRSNNDVREVIDADKSVRDKYVRDVRDKYVSDVRANLVIVNLRNGVEKHTLSNIIKQNQAAAINRENKAAAEYARRQNEYIVFQNKQNCLPYDCYVYDESQEEFKQAGYKLGNALDRLMKIVYPKNLAPSFRPRKDDDYNNRFRLLSKGEIITGSYLCADLPSFASSIYAHDERVRKVDFTKEVDFAKNLINYISSEMAKMLPGEKNIPRLSVVSKASTPYLILTVGPEANSALETKCIKALQNINLEPYQQMCELVYSSADREERIKQRTALVEPPSISDGSQHSISIPSNNGSGRRKSAKKTYLGEEPEVPEIQNQSDKYESHTEQLERLRRNYVADNRRTEKPQCCLMM